MKSDRFLTGAARIKLFIHALTWAGAPPSTRNGTRPAVAEWFYGLGGTVKLSRQRRWSLAVGNTPAVAELFYGAGPLYTASPISTLAGVKPLSLTAFQSAADSTVLPVWNTTLTRPVLRSTEAFLTPSIRSTERFTLKPQPGHVIPLTRITASGAA